MHEDRKLILASKSPRRRALLDAAHIPFELLEIEVDESYSENLPPEEVPEYLARKKAEEAIKVRQDGIILTADSVVIQDGIIFEKPQDREDAIRIIRNLAGRSHYVITGVCLISSDKEISFSDRSDVSLAPMSYEEIAWYVDTFEPYDKAGAYGIQDWIGVTKVTRIEGSYHNIMGLPVHAVYEALREFKV